MPQPSSQQPLLPLKNPAGDAPNKCVNDYDMDPDSEKDPCSETDYSPQKQGKYCITL